MLDSIVLRIKRQGVNTSIIDIAQLRSANKSQRTNMNKNVELSTYHDCRGTVTDRWGGTKVSRKWRFISPHRQVLVKTISTIEHILLKCVSNNIKKINEHHHINCKIASQCHLQIYDQRGAQNSIQRCRN